MTQLSVRDKDGNWRDVKGVVSPLYPPEMQFPMLGPTRAGQRALLIANLLKYILKPGEVHIRVGKVDKTVQHRFVQQGNIGRTHTTCAVCIERKRQRALIRRAWEIASLKRTPFE